MLNWIVVLPVLTWVICRVLMRLAVRWHWFDVPGERSSHQVPTPRVGGLAFGGVFLGVAWVQTAQAGWQHTPWPDLLAVAALYVLGGLDDRVSLSAKLRLVVQLVVVGALLVQWVHPTDWLDWAGVAFLTLCGVWWVNLFNFMDGADGFAGSQGLLMLIAPVGLAWLDLGWVEPYGNYVAAMAAALVGFLVLNWSPARVFMGDAGSLALAAFVAVAGAWWVQLDEAYLGLMLCLASYFVVDATVTLLWRAVHGFAVMSAHRQHAYQCLIRMWGGRHAPVTWALWAFNLAVALPLALVSWALVRGNEQAWAVLPVLVCYALAAGLVLRIRTKAISAGDPAMAVPPAH